MRTQDGMSTAGAPGAIVGRDRELSLLRASLDAGRSGRPGITLVVGEAGIGKSRLADETAMQARAAGLKVLHGEADPSSREPMEVWRGVFRSAGVAPSIDPSLPDGERRWEHLESLVEAVRRRPPRDAAQSQCPAISLAAAGRESEVGTMRSDVPSSRRRDSRRVGREPAASRPTAKPP